MNKRLVNLVNNFYKMAVLGSDGPYLVTDSFEMPSSKGGSYIVNPGRIIWLGTPDDLGNQRYFLSGWGGGERAVPIKENMDKVVNLSTFFPKLAKLLNARIIHLSNQECELEGKSMLYKFIFKWVKEGYKDIGPKIIVERVSSEGDVESGIETGELEDLSLDPQDFLDLYSLAEKVR